MGVLKHFMGRLHEERAATADLPDHLEMHVRELAAAGASVGAFDFSSITVLIQAILAVIAQIQAWRNATPTPTPTPAPTPAA
jgi:hypothetical protein